MFCEIQNGDGAELIYRGIEKIQNAGLSPVIVTDPPFNVGYHYGVYNDRLPEDLYYEKLVRIFSLAPSVVIMYPEMLHKLSVKKGDVPSRVVSWVYNSNTPKQHRDIGFYGIQPNFNQVTQPYKNPNDQRIKRLIASGKKGAKLYDWFNVNQVKNVSRNKTTHPCQMPLEVMRNIIGILPHDIGVIDPFCGSGTTGVACKELGISFLGYDIDDNYCNIARTRLGKDG